MRSVGDHVWQQLLLKVAVYVGSQTPIAYCLVGLVVKVSALRPVDPAFDSHLQCGDVSGSSHTSDLQIDTAVATLPGAWRCRVTTGTGWPGVSIL